MTIWSLLGMDWTRNCRFSDWLLPLLLTTKISCNLAINCLIGLKFSAVLTETHTFQMSYKGLRCDIQGGCNLLKYKSQVSWSTRSESCLSFCLLRSAVIWLLPVRLILNFQQFCLKLTPFKWDIERRAVTAGEDANHILRTGQIVWPRLYSYTVVPQLLEK